MMARNSTVSEAGTEQPKGVTEAVSKRKGPNAGVGAFLPPVAVAVAMNDEALIEAARDIQSEAHVPYSEYRVGAALETAEGEVYVGCNLENANYSNSLHAEEVAIAEAVKNGATEFERLAVSSSRRDGVTPCGMCRQTLAEFCGDDLVVICDAGESVSEYTLGELLPDTITEEMLE